MGCFSKKLRYLFWPVLSLLAFAYGEKQILVIPVKGQINKAQLYILRRVVKEAESRKADAIVLEMDTPGGALQVTLEMMTLLQAFSGETVTYVNPEAISAGSYIAMATDAIYFSPGGIMGAAAVVGGSGQDIDKTMRLKIDSYLRARVRSMAGEDSLRAKIQRAMMDENYVLKIGDRVLKEKGELLSLTADEAVEKYDGQPLLAEGIFENLDALLKARYGKYTVERLNITWSEELAKWLLAIAPVLIGIGMLALFLEASTQGFGFFGVAGIALLGVVFLSNFVAGLSDYTEVVVFCLGLILLFVEIFLLPGTIFFGVLGAILLIGSLVFSFVDLSKVPKKDWFDINIFINPLETVGLGLVIAVVGGFLVVRFLPKRWLWQKFFLTSTSGVKDKKNIENLIGKSGVTQTKLMPSGTVEIDGKLYEAHVGTGSVEANTPIRVKAQRGFSLIVEVEK